MISSRQLGEALGLTDAQVRKDLAYFGQCGQPGVGYRIDELIARLRHILGTDKTWNVGLIGAGNQGRALVSYRGFIKRGFDIVTVPVSSAQQVADWVLTAGVRGVLNFAPVALRQNDRMAVAAVDLAVHLEQLCFQVSSLTKSADTIEKV